LPLTVSFSAIGTLVNPMDYFLRAANKNSETSPSFLSKLDKEFIPLELLFYLNNLIEGRAIESIFVNSLCV